ncbi:MAG: hypothetical protein CME71_05830 [Halobacteriovorax sp.]|nr:hypothetical protein [Halobacteriovorax sp.]
MAAGKLDLDIEFEDEDEAKRLEEARKKREEVKEVDLQFSVEPEEGDDAGASGAALKKAQAQARRAALEKKNAASSGSGENVADLQAARQARAPSPQSEPSIKFNQQDLVTNSTPARPSASSPHYRLGDELNFAISQNDLLNAEVQARIQLAVAQAKTEIIAKAAAEAKLLEHKVVKLLTQAHAKAPAAKAELMAIKKMLAENADPKKLMEEASDTEASSAAPVKKKPSAS